MQTHHKTRFCGSTSVAAAGIACQAQVQQQQIQYQDRQKLFSRIAPIYDQVIMTTALYDLEQLACLSVQVIQLLSRPLLCSQTFALTLQFNDILSLGQLLLDSMFWRYVVAVVTWHSDWQKLLAQLVR